MAKQGGDAEIGDYFTASHDTQIFLLLNILSIKYVLYYLFLISPERKAESQSPFSTQNQQEELSLPITSASHPSHPEQRPIDTFLRKAPPSSSSKVETLEPCFKPLAPKYRSEPAFTAIQPTTLKIKVFKNPPDASGRYALENKRLWHVNASNIGELTLAKTTKQFKEYFNTKNELKLSYFDGEEEMLILKNEYLIETCSFFLQCFQKYENHTEFLKISATETMADTLSTTSVKFAVQNKASVLSMYNAATRSAPQQKTNTNGPTGETESRDYKKMQKMKVKVSNEFNCKEEQADMISKSEIKCTACKCVIKLGKPFNIHNFRRHTRRCKKIDGQASKSISSLFMAMTAIAQRVSDKAKEMVEYVLKLRNKGESSNDSIDVLLTVLDGVADRPCTLEAATDDIKRLCLKVVGSSAHPLLVHLSELCEEGNISEPNGSDEERSSTSEGDDEEEHQDNSPL
ncbi:uncharacterized protein LOC125573792 [Nematostella vectensis]|uniref:uncharacterized protein LOC125573792 n=1 Tax=Nematostella vectensis TaxID=45351 RepID=UPI002076DC27|nr:uncharacterized protein LOC125573792 [Nematostella vectensis]